MTKISRLPSDLFVPTMCIYHGKCFDGFGAAYAVHRKFDNVTFIAGTHGEPPKDFDQFKGHNVLFVDFSYQPSVLLQIIAKANSVMILDHHVSAMKNIAPLIEHGTIWGRFDMDHSGAMLAWQYYHPEHDIPVLISHIEDSDLWRFNLPMTKEIFMGLASYPMEFKVWDRITSVPVETLAGEGSVVLRKMKLDMAEIIDLSERTVTIDGHIVPWVNCPHIYASDIGNIMANKSGLFSATYYDRAGTRRVSLRSIGDFDVSVIASRFGGGGHKNAAGFEVPLGWEGE